MAEEEYMSLSGTPRSIWKDKRFIMVFLLCLCLIASTVVFATLFFKDNGKAKNDAASEFQWLTDDVTSKMNTKIDPCDDFYQYSCGGYISSHPLQKGQHVSNPTFDTITINNYFTLMDLLEQQWPLLSDLYDSCTMDPDTLNQITLATFQDLLGKINVASTAETDFFKTLSFVHSLGSDAFFTPGQSDNIFQTNSLNYLHLILSGISDIDFTNPADTTKLKKQMFQFFQLFNLSDPTQSSQNAFNIEQALFNLVPSDDTSFTMQELYSFMSWNDFLSYVNYDYTEYASNLGITINSNSGVILTLDTYIANITSVIKTQTPQALTSYLQWRTFNSIYTNNPTIIVADDSLVSFMNKKERETTSTLKSIADKVNKNKKVVDTDALKKVFLSSPSQQQLMQKLMCVDAVDSLLGDFLGLLFTLNIIDDDVISDIQMVTNGVQSAFKNSFSDLTWLDQESKVNASYKLSQIIQIIGHPNNLQRYRGLSLDADAYLSNIFLINQQVFLDDMTTVGTVFNRSHFEFSSTIVNAFYSPNTNTINFPAGILESPMFSTSFPTILQFARMGYVIGHETTHGFDNNGRLWNAFGRYQDIMTEQSSDNFVTQAQCIVNQYNNYVAVPSSKLHVNGQKTLGENIADLGGAKNSFRAYQNWLATNGKEKGTDKSPIVKDLTNNQLFFVMLGQTWCTVADDAYLTAQVQQDVHSPAPFRVNGPLSNFDEFSTAFKCKKNSAMNPDTKCNLW